MRVALISMIKRQEDDSALPRGQLLFTGRTIASRQIGMALELGCERIICLADGMNACHLALQHFTEKSGAHFHFAQTALSLSGLVRGADDLFIFADGVLLDHTRMIPLLDDRKGVLVVSAEQGVSAGFERIDAQFAWAGVLRTNGDAVERLAELPSDIEPVSALLRIALQSGTYTVPVPDTLLADSALAMLESAAQAKQCEADWIMRHFPLQSWTAPGNAFADRIVARFAHQMFACGLPGKAGLAAVIALIAAAALADWLGGNTAGFLVLALAALIQIVLARLSGLGSGNLAHAKPERMRAGGVLIDLAIILALALPLFRDISYPILFAGIMLVGLLHLVAYSGPGRLSSLASDRVMLCLILAVAAFGNTLLPTLQVLGLICLSLLLVRTRTAGLTQT